MGMGQGRYKIYPPWYTSSTLQILYSTGPVRYVSGMVSTGLVWYDTGQYVIGNNVVVQHELGMVMATTHYGMGWFSLVGYGSKYSGSCLVRHGKSRYGTARIGTNPKLTSCALNKICIFF